MDKKIFAVAVDGPSGAGKSTIAKRIAAELGIVYVDTGAMYRSVGLYVFRKGVDPKDAEAVTALLPEITVDMCYGDDGLQRMILNGEDVTKDIRLPEISMYASAVSAIPAVRAFLLEMQRSLARRNSVIMDGRDISTVVLPDAEVKIFLTAEAETRAKRRELELMERGTPEPFEKILKELQERDYNDSHRAEAPLRQAEDAVLIDTTALHFDDSKYALLKVIREKTVA